jgi:Ni/Co efflux regulator RcnB
MMLRELLTMKNLLIAGIAAGLALASSPAMAASDSFDAKAERLTASEFGGVYEGRKGGGMKPVMGGMGHGPRPVMGGMGHGPRPTMSGGHHPRPHGGMGNHRWGNKVNGRWFAGYHAPGGWTGYRAPMRGYILPSYWINPGYSISNYGMYGLYAPMTGYGWSRYYDDAVLRDSRGYVQDYRAGIDWNRYEGGYAPDNGYRQPEYGPTMTPDAEVYGMDGRNDSYDEYDDSDVEYREGTGAPYPAPSVQDRYYPDQQAPSYAPAGPAYRAPGGYERYERCLRERGVGGGVIGAVIGAVAGNRIAGRGDRLAGSLIGGGVGALAGMGIEKATNKCRRYLPQTSNYPAPAPQYRPQAPQYYPAPAQPTQGYPHYPSQTQGYPSGGGYYNGYYYFPQPAPTITTVTVSPAVTTTTTTTEEVYYETVSVRRPYVKKWRPKAKPRPKPRCHCH